MAKGKCFGGVAYLPGHPCADLHGLLRMCIRTRSWAEVIRASRERTGETNLGCYPSFNWNSRIWQESKSHIEIALTETHYGEFFVCPLEKQYLSPENYVPLREKKPQSGKPAEKHTGMPPNEWRAS